jgi:hypothetical protein
MPDVRPELKHHGTGDSESPNRFQYRKIFSTEIFETHGAATRIAGPTRNRIPQHALSARRISVNVVVLEHFRA